MLDRLLHRQRALVPEPIDRPCAFDGDHLTGDECVIRPQVVDGAGLTHNDTQEPEVSMYAITGDAVASTSQHRSRRV